MTRHRTRATNGRNSSKSLVEENGSSSYVITLIFFASNHNVAHVTYTVHCGVAAESLERENVCFR